MSKQNLQVFIEDNFRPIIASDGSVSCAQRVFEVKASSRQLKLLKALADCESGILLREELISAVYDDFFYENPGRSMRRTTTRYRTAVKTISRVRISLEKFFQDLAPPGFNWLPWNEKLGGWILFQRAPIDQSMAV